MAERIGPMVVVIRTNDMGEITGIYTDLPLRIIKVGAGGHGGDLDSKTLEHLGPLERVTVFNVLDPYRHLTLTQRNRIRAEAFETLEHDLELDHVRVRKAREWVDAATIAERLALISSDEDVVAGRLGFRPDTGDTYEDDPIDEDEE